jgi:hypothetical protein
VASILLSLGSLSESLAVVPLVGPLLSEDPEDSVLLELDEVGGGDALDTSNEGWEDVDIGVVVDLLGLLGRVVEDATLGLGDWRLFMPGVENQLIHIRQQSVSIKIQGFLASVLAAVVHGDADRPGECGAQPGGLDLSEGEA